MDTKVHQNKLLPEDNKFHAGNGGDGKHYWLTPHEMKERLDGQYHFDFDPCPYPKPDGFDGLTCEWGQSNYVNPPFGSIWHQGPNDKKPKKKGPTAWARKAIEEAKKGKGTNLVYPIDKWVLMLLAAGAKVFNEGDVRWLAIEDGSQGKGTGRHIARFVIGYDQVDVGEVQNMIQWLEQSTDWKLRKAAQLLRGLSGRHSPLDDTKAALLDACRLAEGFLANQAFSEHDPLVRGALRAAIAAAETEAA